MKKTVAMVLFLGCMLSPAKFLAQANPEDIATVSDAFQESFYESLKQKGIENYDKAVQALEKCRQQQPENAVVWYELGKNFLYLKDYPKAYESFDKAVKFDTKNKWYWNGKYEAAFRMEDWKQSIELVQKLIEFDKAYREDLVTLYMKTNDYEKALVLINELNDNVGKSERRELYKAQILRNLNFQGTEIDNLSDLIKKNPKEESNYISLIDLYNQNGQEDKALETAKKLEANIPNSDWAQINLFRSYLKSGENEKAISALNKALASNKIDLKIKHRIFNEFLIFVKNNPQYDNDLEKAIGYFSGDKEVKTAKEVGKFFQSKNDFNRAVRYYVLDQKNNPNDIETALLLGECYLSQQRYDDLLQLGNSMLEIFPMQPEFYYYSGISNNQLKKYDKAQKVLEQGLDYLVDNKRLEANFYIQIGEAYNGLGNEQMKEKFFKKADQLLK